MNSVLFRYRARDLSAEDIKTIKETIAHHYSKGRSHISRVLCQQWNWKQVNGNLKEYAARDLLLRLEEKGFVELPPRKREKNNRKKKLFTQIPIFGKNALEGFIKDYPPPCIQSPLNIDKYLWDYLVHHYHYLGLPTFVGEYLKYFVCIEDQVVACLGWSSAAFKVQARDRFIGWNENTKRQRLFYVANNARFLILPWINIKNLASKVLSLNIRRLSEDWKRKYKHPIYLAETFVDISRFKGTSYQAANWHFVGHTQGSAKKGNRYHYHGQAKALYLYPLHPNFRRLLIDDQR
jgi:hypothetical protein